jgi:hypothetical protein
VSSRFSSPLCSLLQQSKVNTSETSSKKTSGCT